MSRPEDALDGHLVRHSRPPAVLRFVEVEVVLVEECLGVEGWLGTGGRSHYLFGTIQPNSEVRNSDTFGVLKLTLHANSYDWQFVPQAGKTFTDSGTSTCH
jgi:hypothetical protein